MKPNRVLCGRCGKVVCRLTDPQMAGVVVSGLALNPSRPAAPAAEGSRNPSKRPTPTAGGEGARPMAQATVTVGCHPKCGRSYPIRMDRLRTAIAKAQGRSYLIVGVGPFAAERGGADL